MARPLRIEYPGAVYHVTARGNAWQDIFLDDEDRVRFLGMLHCLPSNSSPQSARGPQTSTAGESSHVSCLSVDDRSIETIYQAYRDHGYTQREIAEHLGVHYATITRRIKKWEETERSQGC